MGPQFSSVWYATPERFESKTALIAFSDRGSLEISPDTVQFQGKKQAISMTRIIKASLTRHRIPWEAWVVGLIAYLAYLQIRYSDSLKVLHGAIVMAIGILIGIQFIVKMKWILVEYEDELGTARRAYFTDGTDFGLGAFVGGTTQLLHAIEEQRQGSDSVCDETAKAIDQEGMRNQNST
jgi:hypothetical protein